MFSLKDKVALVTGARRGMGKSHAKILAAQGAKVAVTDIDLTECEAVTKEIVAAGGQAIALHLDVTNKDEVDAVFSKTVKRFGRLDILVNNAGIFPFKPTMELTPEDWDITLSVNLKGQFLCAQRAAKDMIKQKYGKIINIASVSSGQTGVGLAGGTHYAASKGGTIALTESLAVEWAPFGILVNAVAPGAVDTLMSRKTRMPKKEMNAFLKQTVPLNRIGKPEEVSAAVIFLASDEASYITGSTVYVDGGWLAL